MKKIGFLIKKWNAASKREKSSDIYMKNYKYKDWIFYFSSFMGESCVFLERLNRSLIYVPYNLKNKTINWNKITYYYSNEKYYIADFEFESFYDFIDYVNMFIKLIVFA